MSSDEFFSLFHFVNLPSSGKAIAPVWVGVKVSINQLRKVILIPGCKIFGGGGSSAVERATPGEEVPGSIPAVAARSLQVGSVSV